MSDIMYLTPDGFMDVRIQHVEFVRQVKGADVIHHKSRIITYADVKKRKLISLLTNDMESDTAEIMSIYRQRWEIELLFKQKKQNFPLKSFLWRERQRHQDPNPGDADCEPSADGDAEGSETTMELLWTGYYGQDNNDVLRRFLQPIQQP